MTSRMRRRVSCTLFSLEPTHTSIMVTPDAVARHFVDAVNAAGVPLPRTSSATTLLLARQVRAAGVKVLLTGEGADEMFLGDDLFREARIRALWARRPGSPWMVSMAARFATEVASRSYFLLLSAALESPDEFDFSHRTRWQQAGHVLRYLNDDLRHALGGYDVIGRLRTYMPKGVPELPVLRRAQAWRSPPYCRITCSLRRVTECTCGLVLSRGSRTCSSPSSTLPVVYLPNRSVKLATAKRALRLAAAQVLPPEVAWGRKHAYDAPVGAVFSVPPGADILATAASKTSLSDVGVWDPARVLHLKDRLGARDQLSSADSAALCLILSTQILLSGDFGG